MSKKRNQEELNFIMKSIADFLQKKHGISDIIISAHFEDEDRSVIVGSGSTVFNIETVLAILSNTRGIKVATATTPLPSDILKAFIKSQGKEGKD